MKGGVYRMLTEQGSEAAGRGAGTGYGKSGQADIHPLLPFDKRQTFGTEILCPG